MNFKYISIVFLGFSVSIQSQISKEEKIDEITISSKFKEISYADAIENVSIITKKQIENSSARSIDEILQQISGLDVRRRGSNGVQSDIGIRGGNFEQTLILLNGVRLNDSQTGHNSMNIPVDLQNVERIEIIKGPAARRFGNNAYAGVINIITKNVSDKKLRIQAEGGDFSTYRLGIEADYGNEKFTQSFSANSGASDGYRYNTDYKINSVFYQNMLALKNGQIGLQAGISEKKFGANGFYATPRATEQYEEVQASVVSVNLKQKWEKLAINSSLFWRRGQDMYLFNRIKPEIYRNMHIGNNIGAEFNASYQSSVGTTGIGTELRKEFLASNNLGKRERFLTQFFMEHHFSFLKDKLKITPGFTFANYSDQGNFFYPGMDIGYRLSENHQFYGNVARVHRIPSFTDLFYESRTELGNALLKPESAVSYELGYRFTKNSWELRTSHFGRNTNDAIDWTKNNSTDKWRAENIGNVVTRGLDSEISKSFFQNNVKLSVAYTYLDQQFGEERAFSRYALDFLRHQFTSRLFTNYQNWSLELAYRYNDRVNLDSFHVIDSRLSYKKKNWNAYILVNNITNTNYTETFGIPMPGRWAHVGMNFEIK